MAVELAPVVAVVVEPDVDVPVVVVVVGAGGVVAVEPADEGAGAEDAAPAVALA